MMSWRRIGILLFYGMIIMLITVWGLDQQTTPAFAAVIVLSSLFTIMMVLGVDLEEISIDIGGFGEFNASFGPATGLQDHSFNDETDDE